MLAFALLLLVVTGLVLTGSDFALMPLDGETSLLPMSLIIIATVCMSWTLRHWTTISWRRVGMALVIGLSASWITALAVHPGSDPSGGRVPAHVEDGSEGRRLRTAIRISRVETLLAVSLYAAAGFLLALAHPPVLLIVIILVQATVYLCSPIAALWNVRAQRVPAEEYRRRHAERQRPEGAPAAAVRDHRLRRRGAPRRR